MESREKTSKKPRQSGTETELEKPKEQKLNRNSAKSSGRDTRGINMSLLDKIQLYVTALNDIRNLLPLVKTDLTDFSSFLDTV